MFALSVTVLAVNDDTVYMEVDTISTAVKRWSIEWDIFILSSCFHLRLRYQPHKCCRIHRELKIVRGKVYIFKNLCNTANAGMKWHVNDILGVSSIYAAWYAFCDAPMRCIDAIKCCVCEFSSVSKCVGAIWMAKCLSGEGTAHHYDDITTNISIFSIGQRLVEMLFSANDLPLQWKNCFYESFLTCKRIIICLTMAPTMGQSMRRCGSVYQGVAATRRCPSSDSQALSRDKHCYHCSLHSETLCNIAMRSSARIHCIALSRGMSSCCIALLWITIY